LQVLNKSAADTFGIKAGILIETFVFKDNGRVTAKLGDFV